MEFVWIPGGCFQMGCAGTAKREEDRADLLSQCNPDEVPAHKVCVDGFWMGRYEVSQKEWKQLMGKNPAKAQKGDSYPVDSVSWEEARDYALELSRRTGRTFRLPTEAQWEFSCRGHRSEPYCGGKDLDSLAWYMDNSDGSSHPQGEKQANDFGLYDMNGNVWEWCADRYDPAYYQKRVEDNPTGPAKGEARVLRGGSWSSMWLAFRAVNRHMSRPGSRSDNIGFRLVLVQDPPANSPVEQKK
jgi:formylglycine-generating enzyme required for sulfatase activity